MDLEAIDIPRLSETRYLLTLLGIRGFRILVIVLVAWVFIRLMKALSRRIVERAQEDDHATQSEREKRAETLAQVVKFASQIFAVTIGTFMVLRELGLNITPLLTGAGIAGVALGLGSQSMVRDFLNGFFILMENQFRVGDTIRVNGCEGLVEKITLRTTMIRDIEGTLHIIPNGEIKAVSNLTYGWSRVKLDVAVSYHSDLDRVLAVLREVGEGLSRDEAQRKLLLEAPQVLGVEHLGESALTVRLLVKTLPQGQAEVARELRRRVKEAFDRSGFEAPYPHRVIVSRSELEGIGTEDAEPFAEGT
jgi:small-conductance mechanosensitive channel